MPDTGSSFSGSKAVNVLAYVHLRNLQDSTGTCRAGRHLTEYLAKRHDVNLRVLANAGDHARMLPLLGAPWTGFDYHLFDSETSRQETKWILLNRPRAERFWPEAQIVFCTADSYVPTKKARSAVTLRGAACFEDDAHSSDSSFVRQRLKWRFMFNTLVRNADLFHATSHFSADRLAHSFPSIRSRLKVVPDAVTPHFFGALIAAGVQFVCGLGLCKRPFVLVPGGLRFRKDAELIREAWPLLKSLHPDLILVTVNESHPERVEITKTFGDDFRVLGLMPDHALRALYSAAQAVWFPSGGEGFGSPVLDAMACGAPVVASRASSRPEITGDAALLVPTQDVNAHVEALDSVLTNGRLRAELASRGALRAKLFTWESSARQMKEAFDSLL